MKVYFDNAATTPIRKEVIDLMSSSMLSVYGNPSSTHGFGRSAKSSIENARKSISKLLNCDPQEIIFTSGGTESDNSILSCAVRDLGVKKIISSPIEHHAVLETLKDLKIKKDSCESCCSAAFLSELILQHIREAKSKSMLL